MAGVKMSLEFTGFVDLAQAIDRAEGDLRGAVNEALEATQAVVTEQLKTAAAPYQRPNTGVKGYAQGDMYDAIIDGDMPVQWNGPNWAEVPVGFSSKHGQTLAGYIHSRFIYYGNNKGMKPDTRIVNAIAGPTTKKKIHQKQEEILRKYLDLAREK